MNVKPLLVLLKILHTNSYVFEPKISTVKKEAKFIGFYKLRRMEV